MLKTDSNNEQVEANIPKAAALTKETLDTEIRQLMEAKSETKDFPKDEEFTPFSVDDIIHVQKPEDQGQEFNFQGGTGYTPAITGKKGKDNAELRQVDELLASVPRAQGYYLKLEKEIGVNEWQLKMRIDNYEFWSDLEWEITKIVREQTKLDSISYGTAKYRIIVWRENGMRGDKRPPIIFHIDAQESRLPNRSQSIQGNPETVEEKLEGMGKLVAAMQNFMPKPVDPNTQVTQMADAFQKGQELARTKESGADSSMATILTAMMQMQQQNMQFMMTLMKDSNKPAPEDEFSKLLKMKMIESFGEKHTEKRESVVSTIKEFRDAGLIPKKDEGGLTETVKTIMMLKDISGDLFGGGGEKSEGGYLDKLLSGIGEKLPDIIGNVTKTIDNVVSLNKAKLAMMEKGQKPVQNPPKGASVEIPKETAELKPEEVIIEDTVLKTPEDKMNFLVMMFANQLNNWVLDEVHTSEVFDKITAATLKMTEGRPVMQDAIKAGTMQPEDMAKMVIEQLDKTNYTTEEKLAKLLKYCQAYCNYIIGDDKYIAECDTCGQQYNFDTKQEFLDLANDEKYCEEDGCDGTVRDLNDINTENSETIEITGEDTDQASEKVSGEEVQQ